jgi:peroxiredoxin
MALSHPITASGRSPPMTTPPTIAEGIAQMHAVMAAEPPGEPMGAFAREQAELAASAPPPGIAAPGTVLPDADLLDVYGAPTTLYAEAGGDTAVLVFYRGAWCPYCNIALSAYQQHLLPKLTARGIALLAISPQVPDGSLSMQQKHGLTCTVVSDPGSTIARGLGIVTQPSGGARAAQLELGLDLTTVNADSTIALPMPTVAITDAGHTLRWIDVHLDYSTRTEPGQVLAALGHLGL